VFCQLHRARGADIYSIDLPGHGKSYGERGSYTQEECMERLIEVVKSTPPAKGYDEVLVAGDPEWRMEAERRANGIPLESGTWKSLTNAALRLGVASPTLGLD
jgi:LDH2 family malate/lactate/ureidoglycolate dehydrogenase